MAVEISSEVKRIAFLMMVFVTYNGVGDAAESTADIHFYGRWDLSDTSNPWCAWQGSTFAAEFEGRQISATLEADREEYIRVILDGDHRDSRRIRLAAGRCVYELANGVDLGRHRIEVVKETYSGRGRLYLHGLESHGGEIISSERRRPRLRLQFYGDSNLAGNSLEHERDERGAEFSGCHYTFAGIVSRMLDAEYQNISVTGARILGSSNSVLSFFDRMDFYEAQPKWKFERFPADVCILNIGANNANRNSKEEILRDYLILLRRLREVHPESHIVVMNGYGWDRNEPANYTDEVVRKFADDNTSRVIFPWLFNEWHGCEYDHAGMARFLAEHLETVCPDWKAIRSMDVLDGFGRNGDVANGSFEEVAPFGGFAWRYFQEGAIRVHDPAGSSAGEWFLRLPEKSQVHQPNPASKSRCYTYRLMLRSPDSGEAKIRIEFRDQHFRSEIEGAAQEFVFNLESEWREYSVRVESPGGTGEPSQDTWQIILRLVSNAGTVECDNVRLSEGGIVGRNP